MTGGYCMFIKGGRVYFDYNFLDGVDDTLENRPKHPRLAPSAQPTLSRTR